MLDELKDLRAIVDSAIRNLESGDTVKYKKSMERASLLCDQILRADGTRFSAVDEDNPLDMAMMQERLNNTVTKQDIIDGGVPK